MQTYNMPHRKLQRRQEALERRKNELKNAGANAKKFGWDNAMLAQKIERAQSDIANLEAKLGMKS